MDNVVQDFFCFVKEGKLSDLEINNKVEELTNGFELEKLKLLKKDLEFYLLVEKEEKGATYTHKDIQNAIKKCEENSWKIPLMELPFLKDNKVKVISKEGLLFPYEFILLYSLIYDLEKRILKATYPNIENIESTLRPKIYSKVYHKELDRICNRAISSTGLFKNFKDQSDFSRCFENLYHYSLDEMYLWQYSPFAVYEANIEELIKEYLEKNPDAALDDFYRKEIEEIESNWRDERFEDFGSGGTECVILKEGFVYFLKSSGFTDEIWLGFLGEEIVQNIRFTQNKKLEFLKSKTENQGRLECNGSNTKRKIFNAIDTNHKTCELENEYNYLNDLHKLKYGIDIPLGGFIFDELKREANLISELKERILFYQKQLHYWTELSLKDNDIITEPEIKERLIPLIKVSIL